MSDLAISKELIQKLKPSDQDLLFQILDPSKNNPNDIKIKRLALNIIKETKSEKKQENWKKELAPHQSPLTKQLQILLEKRKELKKKFLQKNKEMSFLLKEEEVEMVINQYFAVIHYYEKYRYLTLKEIDQFAQEKGLEVEKRLALGCLGVKKLYRTPPYDTQIITVLGSLISTKGKKGTLAQVKTGEGKSLIIPLQALLLSLGGRSVDIISSSHFLSKRDQKKYEPFFKLFGITTSHICDTDPKPGNFNADIVYGMATDFEFALMKEKVHGIHLFTDQGRKKSFDCVIVDEVDNLLIDTALNSARISYPTNKRSETFALEVIFQLAKNHGDKLPAEKAALLIQSHLKEKFSVQQLKTWWLSALEALRKKPGVEYIVNHKKGTSEISIIDQKNTGELSKGMRWGSGLHEFLEIKHHIKLQQESVTPIALSHAVFYDMYKNIYGFSGTLGSDIERRQIEEVYQIDTFDVPPHRPSKRKDTPPIFFKDPIAYRETLVKKLEVLRASHRPTLIISSSIRESLSIHELLRSKEISSELFNGIQRRSTSEILKSAGQPKAITVATNTAGRGTDIVLDPLSAKNGGLHVIFTYFPSSKRVEDQGIGRAGRQGQEGSSEILVLDEKTTIENTDLWRQMREVHTASALKKRAACERCVAQYTNNFWKIMATWRKKLRAQQQLKIIRGKLSLTLKNQLLKKLKLASPPSYPIAVDFLIEKLISEIEKEVIHKWARVFFEPSEKLILKHQNKETSLETFKKEITQLFKQSRPDWSKLMEDSGWLLYLKT